MFIFVKFNLTFSAGHLIRQQNELTEWRHHSKSRGDMLLKWGWEERAQRLHFSNQAHWHKKRRKKEDTPHYATIQVTAATEIEALYKEFIPRQVSEYFWNSIFAPENEMSEFHIQILTLCRLCHFTFNFTRGDDTVTLPTSDFISWNYIYWQLWDFMKSINGPVIDIQDIGPLPVNIQLYCHH